MIINKLEYTDYTNMIFFLKRLLKASNTAIRPPSLGI